jgi:hypothetical protein
MVRGYKPHAQSSRWRTTPCRLSATAYSMYSQLTSIDGDRPSFRDRRTRHDAVTGSHQTWNTILTVFTSPHVVGVTFNQSLVCSSLDFTYNRT